jgi:hypothetical protein
MHAAQDGAAARRRGEARDPAPYLSRNEERRGLLSPSQAWLAAYDREDERLAFEASRPSLPGQDLWQPIRRAAPDSPIA